MSKIPQLTKELEEAKAELIEVDKEYFRLEFHRKHLHEVIKSRKEMLKECHRGTLAPVEVQVYERDNEQKIIERNRHYFDRVSEATEVFDFSKFDYMDMGVDCSFDEDNFSAVFSMSLEMLPKVIKEGDVVLCSFKGYSQDSDYFTGILTSPTYFHALQEFHKSIYTTRDKHHIFLEGVREITDKAVLKRLKEKFGEGVTFMEFCTGS